MRLPPLASSALSVQPCPYQVGGSLSQDAPSYVVRSADTELFQALHQGEFCYVFNTRQMGKSSLRVQVKHQLQQAGDRCASIDLTRLGSERLTVAQWYKGLMFELWRTLDLMATVDLISWLRSRSELSPVQQLGQFLDEVLLVQVPTNIIIFIDEIDSVLSLDFPSDDFFALIRSCYERRPEQPAYRRLTFALLGVATPAALIRDPIRTPFNLGRAIALQGFEFAEVAPLISGLEGVIEQPATVLKEILKWTGGQPFLTQKLCRLLIEEQDTCAELRSPPRPEETSAPAPFLQQLVQEALAHHSDIAIQVETLVRSRLIEHWEAQDHPEHFKTIYWRLLHDPQRSPQLLRQYLTLLQQGSLAIDHSPEQAELLLSGLVVRQGYHLYVRNLIYLEIFNVAWVQQMLLALAGTSPPGVAPAISPDRPPNAGAIAPTESSEYLATQLIEKFTIATPQQQTAMIQAIVRRSPTSASQLAQLLLAACRPGDRAVDSGATASAS